MIHIIQYMFYTICIIYFQGHSFIEKMRSLDNKDRKNAILRE